MNKKWVIIISSLIWTLLHLNSSIVTFIFGIFIGYLYYETKSLSLCIVLHFIFNLTIGTEIFYVLYKEMGSLTYSSFQYAIALFLLQLILFFSMKMLFNKTQRITTSEAGSHDI